jgi:hypothetical protein
MLDGNHHNDLPTDAEVDVVGKSLEQRAPGVTLGNRKLEWRLHHRPKSR